MKKRTALLIAMLLIVVALFPVSASAVSAKQPITVWIGEQQLSFDVPPVMVEGTTYVELKSLFRTFGYTLVLDSASRTITGTSVFGTMSLNLASGKAAVNGKPIASAFRVITKEGRTLVPLKLIAAITGAKVEWDAASQKVLITTNRIKAAQEIEQVLAQLDAHTIMRGMLAASCL